MDILDNDNGIELKPLYDKILLFSEIHNNNQYSGTGIGLSIAKRR
jgi:light-regulated signal transduction histidine kinase (bacteriophytochrome)